MKKSILIIITLLCAVAQGAWAQTWTDVNTKEALNEAISDDEPLIRLTGDIQLSEYLSIGYNKNQNLSIDQSVTLDLNGHTLSRNLTAADRNGHVIEVHSKGDLMIIDSSDDRSGTITGGWANNGGGICNYGTLTITGGTITGCKASEQGGGIKNNAGATLIIRGRVIITGNSAPNGGGIYNADGGTMTIEGIENGTMTNFWSSISNNTATEDGGGIVNRGTATISAAYISGNQAGVNGGGIWNSGTLSIATQYLSVEIKNNTCKGEGGGLWNSGTIDMQGVVVVKDNHNVTVGNMDSNLFLKTGTKINVTGQFAGLAQIYVCCENYQKQVITSGYQNATPSANKWIKSDVTGFNIRYADSELEFYQTASGTPIRYIDRSWDDSSMKVVATQRIGFAQNIAETYDTNLSGFYYVNADVTTTAKLYASGDVHLILCDGASLTANCLINDEHSIYIYGQTAGTGRFTATDPDSGYPGIGSHGQKGKDINICGGVITVKGANECAGIGGGYYKEEAQFTGTPVHYQNCSNINIYGGTVNAQGGDGAAGIGGARNSDYSGNVYIYGGTVNATGGGELWSIFVDEGLTSGGGAGIGGGDYCVSGGNIYIKGGTVTANGGSEAAGIGVGQNSYNSQFGNPNNIRVYISGGTVTATGGDRGAGIGGGDGVSGSRVEISGGTVRAYAGVEAAGIGSGEGADDTHGGKLTITGGFVEAWGKEDGAGIGAGEDAALGTVSITGGTLIAHGGDASNAICTHDVNGTNDLEIGNQIRLRISENILPYNAREWANIQTYHDIQIEPCTHSSVTYTVNGTDINGTHTMHCSHCSYNSKPETHTFENGTCTVCHVSGSTKTVRIYLPEEVDESYIDGHYASTPITQTLVTGSTFELPAPPDSYLPTGFIFAGWRVGTPEGLTSYCVGENEQVLQSGTSYTVNTDVSLTARFNRIGDINLDGKVDIADVTTMVDIVLNRATDEHNNADLNGNGSVTIEDVTILVNIILGKYAGN